MPQLWKAAGAEGEKSGVGVNALCAARRLGSVATVIAPAGDCAIRFDAAAMDVAGADGEESGVGLNALRAACRAGSACCHAPQQATVLSALMPQVWKAPALTARNLVLASTP